MNKLELFRWWISPTGNHNQKARWFNRLANVLPDVKEFNKYSENIKINDSFDPRYTLIIRETKENTPKISEVIIAVLDEEIEVSVTNLDAISEKVLEEYSNSNIKKTFVFIDKMANWGYINTETKWEFVKYAQIFKNDDFGIMKPFKKFEDFLCRLFDKVFEI